MLRYVWLSLLVIATTLQLGCGPAKDSGATVKGKLTLGGQQFTGDVSADAPPGTIAYSISLFPAETGGVEHPGVIEEGVVLFTSESSDPPGIPPGKYKLVMSYFPSGDWEQDDFNGALSEENSPIEIDVPASAKGGEHDFGTIDLDQHLNK